MRFDSTFFEKNQKRLLRIANSRFSRWILGLNRLPEELKDWKIDKITPNSIHRRIVNGNTFKVEYEAAFFTRNRFGEALAFNLAPLAYLQTNNLRSWKWRFSPVGALGMIALFFIAKEGKGLFALPFFGTTSTIYPTGNDRTIYKENSTSWSTTHDATDGQGGTTNGYCAGRLIGSTYGIYRFFTKFDTSIIGDSDTISSATFALYGEDKPGSPNSQTFNVYGSTAQDTLDESDYDQGGTTAFSSSPIVLTDWNISGYNTFQLNASGISAVNKTGYTKLSLRQAEYDVGNTAPTISGDIRIGFSTSAYTGTTRDPYLSVTYSSVFAPTVTPQNNLAMLGVS